MIFHWRKIIGFVATASDCGSRYCVVSYPEFWPGVGIVKWNGWLYLAKKSTGWMWLSHGSIWI
jgi:hypothetical protein